MNPRIARLRDPMAARGLRAMVLSEARNVFYASGYESTLERWMQLEPLSAVIVGSDRRL